MTCVDPRSQVRATIGLGSQGEILQQLHSAGTGCSSSAHLSVQAEGINVKKNPLVTIKTSEILIFAFAFLSNCLCFTFSHLISVKGYIWLHTFVNSIKLRLWEALKVEKSIALFLLMV